MGGGSRSLEAALFMPHSPGPLGARVLLGKCPRQSAISQALDSNMHSWLVPLGPSLTIFRAIWAGTSAADAAGVCVVVKL